MATEIIAVQRGHKFRWPDAQLNFWLLIMFAASATILGIFAWFMTVQQQMGLGIPWLFPFEVTVGAMTLIFLLTLLRLISEKQLLPNILLLGSFILLVLWLTGLVQTSILYLGSSGGVNGNCNLYVNGQTYGGTNIATLVYLTQKTICNCWSAAFAFEIVGCVFWIWMMVMAWQVSKDEYE